MHAFQIGAGGALTSLGVENTKGDANCSVICTSDNKRVLCANYSGGSVAVFDVNSDGSLGAMCDFHQLEGSSVNAVRQEKAHAHMVLFDPSEEERGGARVV